MNTPNQNPEIAFMEALREKVLAAHIENLKTRFPTLFASDDAAAVKAVQTLIEETVADTRAVIGPAVRRDVHDEILFGLGKVMEDDLAQIEKEGPPAEVLAQMRDNPNRAVLDIVAASYMLVLRGIAVMSAGGKLNSAAECDCPTHRQQRAERAQGAAETAADGNPLILGKRGQA